LDHHLEKEHSETHKSVIVEMILVTDPLLRADEALFVLFATMLVLRFFLFLGPPVISLPCTNTVERSTGTTLQVRPLPTHKSVIVEMILVTDPLLRADEALFVLFATMLVQAGRR
jgi:hypothetical protein